MKTKKNIYGDEITKEMIERCEKALSILVEKAESINNTVAAYTADGETAKYQIGDDVLVVKRTKSNSFYVELCSIVDGEYEPYLQTVGSDWFHSMLGALVMRDVY